MLSGSDHHSGAAVMLHPDRPFHHIIPPPDSTVRFPDLAVLLRYTAGPSAVKPSENRFKQRVDALYTLLGMSPDIGILMLGDEGVAVRYKDLKVEAKSIFCAQGVGYVRHDAAEPEFVLKAIVESGGYNNEKNKCLMKYFLWILLAAILWILVPHMVPNNVVTRQQSVKTMKALSGELEHELLFDELPQMAGNHTYGRRRRVTALGKGL